MNVSVSWILAAGSWQLLTFDEVLLAENLNREFRFVFLKVTYLSVIAVAPVEYTSKYEIRLMWGTVEYEYPSPTVTQQYRFTAL